jgi:hypothetical protein
MDVKMEPAALGLVTQSLPLSSYMPTTPLPSCHADRVQVTTLEILETMDSDVELAAFEPVNKKARESGAAELPDQPTQYQQHRQEQFRQDQQRRQQQQQGEGAAAPAVPAAAAAAGEVCDVAMEDAGAAAAAAAAVPEYTPGARWHRVAAVWPLLHGVDICQHI